MAEVTNYQCPSCNAPLRFDADSGKLMCDYCQSSFTAEEVDAYYAVKNAKAAQNVRAWDTSGTQGEWDAASVKAYSCPSCGAQLICDAVAAATSCPYCGNNTIIPGNLSGAIKPNFVIPFKLDKEAATSGLKKHYKGKPFLPKSFRAENHISEIRGIYVPFWLFDCSADAAASFRGTRTHSSVEGKYRVTTTEHFEIERAGIMDFASIPVDASEKMPDAHMDSIEPFDYTGLKPFSNAYLAGYAADRYDVGPDDSFERADARVRQSAVQVLCDTVSGYESVSTAWEHISLVRGEAKYALLPVWILNTKWKDKDFLFAMNGQTGKLVGDLPISWAKVLIWFGGLTLGLSLLFALIMLLF